MFVADHRSVEVLDIMSRYHALHFAVVSQTGSRQPLKLTAVVPSVVAMPTKFEYFFLTFVASHLEGQTPACMQ